MTGTGDIISVEVAYATPAKQVIRRLMLPAGSTVRQAAEAAHLNAEFPELDLDSAKLGIFSKAVPKPDQEVLRDGDRVEIYRPLLIDPKQARLNRAKKAARDEG